MARDSDGSADRAHNPPPPPDTLIPSQRARRHRIVLGALALLERQPYDKIQMRDVAEEADVALGTVYRYFGSKEHLFAAVLVEWGNKLSLHVQRRPLRGDTPAERLDALMMRILTAFERWPDVFGAVMLIDTTTDPYARDLHREFASREAATMADALEGLSDSDAELIVRVTNAMLSSVMRSWSHGTITMAEARRLMTGTIELIFSPPPQLGGLCRDAS